MKQAVHLHVHAAIELENLLVKYLGNELELRHSEDSLLYHALTYELQPLVAHSADCHLSRMHLCRRELLSV